MSMAAGARAGVRLLRLGSSTTFSRASLPGAPAASAASSSSSSSSPLSSSLMKSRGFASEHGHGSGKVNMWEQPTNPGNWKEEQFVLISLSGWFLLFYGGYKAATGGRWFMLFYGGYKAAFSGNKPKASPKPAVMTESKQVPVTKAGSGPLKREEVPGKEPKDDLAVKRSDKGDKISKKEGTSMNKLENNQGSKKNERHPVRKDGSPATKKEINPSAKKEVKKEVSLHPKRDASLPTKNEGSKGINLPSKTRGGNSASKKDEKSGSKRKDSHER